MHDRIACQGITFDDVLLEPAYSDVIPADVDVRIFGEPMHFWRNCMPEGMLLRSPWRYSQISDPRGAFSLDRFAGIEELRPVEQLPIATFLRYADWFQRQAVPDVDRRMVSGIERTAGGFRLLLGEGDSCRARRIVVATGLAAHARATVVEASRHG